jgi:hypothetical protein
MASTAIYVRDYRKEIPGALSPDRKQWDFPPIESINSHKKKMFWRIYVRCFTATELGDKTAKSITNFLPIEDSYFDSKPMNLIYAWINVDSGIEGGKIKDSVPTIIKVGKNIGKVSATNIWTQALRDAYSIYNKQLRKSTLSAKTTSTTELFPPMLAQVLKAQKVPPKISVDSPVFVQRKYNGVRTIATLECGGTEDQPTYSVILYSRRKNTYPGFIYLKEELLPLLTFYWEAGRKLYLDGEIYKHGELLQNISGFARREDQDRAGAPVDL